MSGRTLSLKRSNCASLCPSPLPYCHCPIDAFSPFFQLQAQRISTVRGACADYRSVPACFRWAPRNSADSFQCSAGRDESAPPRPAAFEWKYHGHELLFSIQGRRWQGLDLVLGWQYAENDEAVVGGISTRRGLQWARALWISGHRISRPEELQVLLQGCRARSVSCKAIRGRMQFVCLGEYKTWRPGCKICVGDGLAG